MQRNFIGRLDYLGIDGNVGDSMEFDDILKFKEQLFSDCYYGIPVVVVLYKDSQNNHIPLDFINDLDPPPKGLKIIENPHTELNPILEIKL